MPELCSLESVCGHACVHHHIARCVFTTIFIIHKHWSISRTQIRTAGSSVRLVRSYHNTFHTGMDSGLSYRNGLGPFIQEWTRTFHTGMDSDLSYSLCMIVDKHYPPPEVNMSRWSTSWHHQMSVLAIFLDCCWVSVHVMIFSYRDIVYWRVGADEGEAEKHRECALYTVSDVS